MEQVNIDLERWTVFNPNTEIVTRLTDQGFKNLIEMNGITLKGEYINVNMNHPEASRLKHTQRIWIDGKYKEGAI